MGRPRPSCGSPREASLIVLLWLLACPKKESNAEALPPPPPPAPPPALAGRIEQGVFLDQTYPFSFPIPQGWTPEIGVDAGSLRLGIRDPDTGARMEVYAVNGYLTLPSHNDCRWKFEDIGHYAGVQASTHPSETLVAHCTPTEVAAPRRLAACRQRGDLTLCLEGHIPPGTLGQYHSLPGQLLDTLR